MDRGRALPAGRKTEIAQIRDGAAALDAGGGEAGAIRIDGAVENESALDPMQVRDRMQTQQRRAGAGATPPRRPGGRPR